MTRVSFALVFLLFDLQLSVARNVGSDAGDMSEVIDAQTRAVASYCDIGDHETNVRLSKSRKIV